MYTVLIIAAILVSASAQCPVRRNLAQNEEAVAARSWNLSLTSEYKLPGILTGAYNYVQEENFGVQNRKLTRHALEVFWTFVFEPAASSTTGKPEPPTALKNAFVVDMQHKNGPRIKIVAKTEEQKMLLGNKDMFPLRGRIHPTFSPVYRKLLADYTSATQLYSSGNLTQVYPQTRFPWLPCPNDRYTDNEVVIFGPYISTPGSKNTFGATAVSDSRISSSPLKYTTQIVSNRAVQKVTNNNVALHLCEDAVARNKNPQLITDFLLQSHATQLYENGESITHAVPLKNVSSEWKIDASRPAVLAAPGGVDICAREWSEQVLAIRNNTNPQQEWKISFAATNTDPHINNLYGNRLSGGSDCLAHPLRDALYRLNTPSGRSNVRYSHICLPKDNPTPIAEYSWSYTEDYIHKEQYPSCTNRGTFAHKWMAHVCGRTATSSFIVQVRDTMGPKIEKTNPYVTHSKGKHSGLFYCHWPSTTNKICLGDILRTHTSQVYTDNCDSRDLLVVTPQWSQGAWASCTHLHTNTNGKTTCNQVDAVAFRPTRQKDSTIDICLFKSDLIHSGNAVFKYTVPMAVTDACGNAAQGEDELIFSLVFADPSKREHGDMRPDLCAVSI